MRILKPTKDKIRNALNDLIDTKKEITEKNIEDLLRDIRRIGYNEYEEKFKGDNFDLIRGQWRMPNLDLDSKSFWKTILKVYQEKESTFSAAVKESIVGELQKLDGELKKFNSEAEQKLTKKEQELLQPMNDKINAAIDAVALREGYFQVIDKKSVYFSKAICDATQFVIEEANKTK